MIKNDLFSSITSSPPFRSTMLGWAGWTVVVCLISTALAAYGQGPASSPLKVDQGSDWTRAKQREYYSTNQGSRLIPLAWIEALKQPNDENATFMADSLQRYGYLPNHDSPERLPVGFTVDGHGKDKELGMTCPACHTRQISVSGKEYRIDGGPAIVDFEAFLSDLDVATGKVLNSDDAFNAFATRVLGSHSSPTQRAALKQQLQGWFLSYDTLMKGALPADGWGVARLDAVGMIFNRLTGVDIGLAPNYLIPANIRVADAPVRYPFLWNATKQDYTQWPGFSANGNDLLGLARNLGEVYGVFATFHPHKSETPLKIDYLGDNSASFRGLQRQETLTSKIGPPKWPWALDSKLVEKGEKIFARSQEQGGCVGCHGISKGKFRSLTHETWATPLLDVGTDTREYSILAWTADTGVLNGARVPFSQPLKPIDTSFDILATSVAGSILQDFANRNPNRFKQFKSKLDAVNTDQQLSLPTELSDYLKSLTAPVATADTSPQYKYESRVLQGIWAAAPYLHNGSVPTLADLMKPSKDRPAEFMVGPAYDITRVGLAAQQTKFNYTLKTTGCDQLNSGNSHCGHDFGVDLSDDDKNALLEYLKSL